MKENKPYFKIYSNKNKRAKSKGVEGKNIPLWFNYKIEELEDLNSLKKYLNVGGIPISLENQKEGFMKNIKKTNANQIKYLLEDMDEEVRRLKNAVLYVGFCNRELKKVMKNEEQELESKMNRLEKILKTSNTNTYTDNPDTKESGNSTPNANKNYMISNCVSDNNLQKDLNNSHFVKNTKENDTNKKPMQNNYLLTQLQRQLFELNSKLKNLKEEYSELQKEELFQKLEQIKKNMQKEKKEKKEKMIELHQLEEKYIERKTGEGKILDLKKK